MADLTPATVYPRDLRALTMEGERSTFCEGCGGFHKPDPPNYLIGFKGHRYTPPFYCLCCGIQICARQFTYGRLCGYCDTGECHKTGEHPRLQGLVGQPYPRGEEPCPQCQGTGAVAGGIAYGDPNSQMTCPRCNGSGIKPVRKGD